MLPVVRLLFPLAPKDPLVSPYESGTSQLHMFLILSFLSPVFLLSQLWEHKLRELEEGIQEGQKSIKPGPKEPLVVKEKFIQMKVRGWPASGAP